jgi:hypothetical protein
MEELFGHHLELEMHNGQMHLWCDCGQDPHICQHWPTKVDNPRNN